MTNRQPLIEAMVVVGVIQVVFNMLDWGKLDTDLTESIITVVTLAIGTWRAHRKVTPVANPKNDEGVPLVPATDYIV